MVKDSLTLWGFSWDGWNSCLCGLSFRVSLPGIAHSWQKGSPNRRGQTSMLKCLSSSYLYHTCLWLTDRKQVTWPRPYSRDGEIDSTNLSMEEQQDHIAKWSIYRDKKDYYPHVVNNLPNTYTQSGVSFKRSRNIVSNFSLRGSVLLSCIVEVGFFFFKASFDTIVTISWRVSYSLSVLQPPWKQMVQTKL